LKIDIHIQAESLEEALQQMRGALAQVSALQATPALNPPPAAASPGEGVKAERAEQEAAVEAEVAAATGEKPKATRKPRTAKADEPKADAPADEPKADEPAGADPLADEPKAEAVTLEQARQILGLLQTHHPEKTAAVVKIVTEHGKAARLSAADPSTYPAMVAAAREWLHANGHPNA
jgi:hypothetical protein